MNRPDVTILTIDGKTPRIHPSAFVAPGCRIIGDVEIGPDVSIWYNCVIRADVNAIRIGARTNIQDGSVVHCDGPKPDQPQGWPTIIGEDVLIGHMTMIHGCMIERAGFVGLGAILMNGVVIGEQGMVGAGAMVTENKRIGPRELWVGRPAKYLRDLPDAALKDMAEGVDNYVENGRRHQQALAG